MTLNDFAVWFRWFLVTTTVVIFPMTLWRIHQARKSLPFSYKLFAAGSLLALLYMTDACRDAASSGIGFKPRLIAYTFSLICFFVYMLEPRRSRERRIDLQSKLTHSNLPPGDSDDSSDPSSRDG